MFGIDDAILWPMVANIGGQMINGMNSNNTANRQMNAYNQGVDKAATLYQQNIDSYSPYTDAGKNALSSYQDLLNGKNDFASSPYFQYQTQLMNQRMAQSRNLASPSAQAIYSAPLVANEYANTISRLQPLITGGMQATQGQDQARGSLASLYMNQGLNQAGAYQNQGANDTYSMGNMMGSLNSLYANSLYGGGFNFNKSTNTIGSSGFSSGMNMGGFSNPMLASIYAPQF